MGMRETTLESETGSGAQASRPAIVSWLLFDWATQPFYTLVLTFLFAPYFASAVVSDPVQGQAYWGYASAIAGILIAVASPLFGALGDRSGRRKPWLALFSIVLTASLGLLWLAVPDAPLAPLLIVLAAYVTATVAAELATVFTNAMMTTLVRPDRLGRLSGTGWAIGYVGGLVSLLIMAGFVVTAPGSDPTAPRTLFGLTPIIVLDGPTREADRLVGPFSAVWFVLFVIPLFLFVPDRGRPPSGPARSAFSELKETLRDLAGRRDLLLFLLARMLYNDGLSAIFTFGGIFGATMLGWQAAELGILGIVLTLTGAIGAVIGGRLDDRIGAKPVIVGSLLLLFIASAGILSVSRDKVMFVIDVASKLPGSAPYSSTSELVFMAFAVVVGMVAGPVQAASRSLFARLAPEDRMTQYFGLFAFSGKVMAFAAPLLVAAVTVASGDQRLGMATIGVFLVAGLALLVPVRVRTRQDAPGGA